MLVDSHCHLHLIDYQALGTSMHEVIEAAFNEGITDILCVATHLNELDNILSITKNYQNIYASIGIHPNETTANEPDAEALIALANHPKIIAIGETGLDFYRDNDDKQVQKQRFKNHITAARMVKKPLIVHTRQAKDETLALLKNEKALEVGGVLHCFTEDWDMAKRLLDLNFYISFSGIITFKNAKDLQEVAKQVPLERILLETDSPYLAPNPYRGKINQPVYVKEIAKFIAQLRDISIDEVCRQTTDNFNHLFKNRANQF